MAVLPFQGAYAALRILNTWVELFFLHFFLLDGRPGFVFQAACGCCQARISALRVRIV